MLSPAAESSRFAYDSTEEDRPWVREPSPAHPEAKAATNSPKAKTKVSFGESSSDEEENRKRPKKKRCSKASAKEKKDQTAENDATAASRKQDQSGPERWTFPTPEIEPVCYTLESNLPSSPLFTELSSQPSSPLRSDSLLEEADGFASDAPWEMPLPPDMDPRDHLHGSLERLADLLHVKVGIGYFPPTIKVDFSASQKTLQFSDPSYVEEHLALKWKAWSIIFAWTRHLDLRVRDPSIPPIDPVSFARNQLMAEGREAKDWVLSQYQAWNGGETVDSNSE